MAGARVWFVVVLGVLAGTSTVAHADRRVAQKDDQREEERKLYQEGITHYNLGEFEQAIVKFKQAFAIRNSPALLFNIAQSYRLLENYEQALFFYKTFIRLRPDAPNRPDVEARIAEMERLIQESTRVQGEPPRGTMPPDDKGTTTQEHPAPPVDGAPPPGDPAPTDTGTALPDPVRDVVPTPARDRPRAGRGKRIAGLATAGAGVVLLGTGVYFGLQAASASDELSGVSADQGMWSPEHTALHERGKRDATISLTCLTVGGIALVGGGVLYYLGWRQDRAASLAVVPSPGGISVAVSWTY